MRNLRQNLDVLQELPLSDLQRLVIHFGKLAASDEPRLRAVWFTVLEVLREEESRRREGRPEAPFVALTIPALHELTGEELRHVYLRADEWADESSGAVRSFFSRLYLLIHEHWHVAEIQDGELDRMLQQNPKPPEER